MFSFRVEYAIRILIEFELRSRSGIARVPLVWFRSICGGDSRGLSIVMRLLQKIGWVGYDPATFLYSSNINIYDISLYDVCLRIDENMSSLPPALRNDKVSMKFIHVFENIRLSDLIL